MSVKTWYSKYAILVWSIVLLPNITAIFFGVASFPFTCAPMFAHRVNDESKLCVLTFEGSNACETVDLIENYGRNETFFVRYFFSKVYGSSQPINPFDARLSENKEDFYRRMNAFFQEYILFLKDKKQLSFDRITLKVKQVDEFRGNLSSCTILGYYDAKVQTYISLYENTENKL